MSNEHTGAPRIIRLGTVVIEVCAVYPNQDEDADPIGWKVEIYQRVTSTVLNKEDARALLSTFGGVPNLWS